MRKKMMALLLAVLLLVNAAACSSGTNGRKRYEAEFLQLFDTATKIVAYTNDKEEFTRMSQLIYDNLKVYHQLYDIYHDYPGISNIKTINDNAGIRPVKVDKKIIDLLSFARQEYFRTNGKMNVAMGAVLKIWHKYRTEGMDNEEGAELPPIDRLKKAARHTDINKVKIDEAGSTVYLEDPEMSLDVGAIAKGYATEQVSRIAMKNGFSSGIISVGGNVRSVGSKGDRQEPWNLGIQNPDLESGKKMVAIVYVKDLSVVSSGDYERYYTVNGKRYHHIIDPLTLYPTTYFHQITILCKDSGLADALSTAVFNMPYEEGLKYVDSLPDVEAMWVLQNGEIKYSEGFEKYLKKP